MKPGETRVKGEYWLFCESDLADVLETLDAIEGTNQPGVADLYQRIIVDVFGENMTPIGRAYAYHYAIDPTIDGFRRMKSSDDQNEVVWNA